MRPLVTLIPAYKQAFLAELFLGLRTQTHTAFSIILSDDSPDGVISRQIRAGVFDALIRGLDLHVVEGPRLGPMSNIRHMLRMLDRDASHVHVHLDDDVIYPDFYRQHVRVLEELDAPITVSARWVTRSDGRPAAELPLPQFIETSPRRVVEVDAATLYASTVAVCKNWLGEMSNMVLSRAAATAFGLGALDGISYYGLGDVGVLLDVVRTAPIAFIRDHLSGFRSSSQQRTHDTQSFALKCGFLAWVALALAAHRQGRIEASQVRDVLATIVKRASSLYPTDTLMGEFFGLAEGYTASPTTFGVRFLDYWSRILADDEDASDVPTRVVMFGDSTQGMAMPI